MFSPNLAHKESEMRTFSFFCSSMAVSSALVLLLSCSSPPKKIEKVVDINAIAGKPLDQVKTLLGEPTNVTSTKISDVGCPNNLCDRYDFQDGKFEVVFIRGVADLITINNVSNLPIDKHVITALGLPAVEPTFSKNPKHGLMWKDIEGLKMVSFFSDKNDRVRYIYVQTNTEF